MQNEIKDRGHADRKRDRHARRQECEKDGEYQEEFQSGSHNKLPQAFARGAADDRKARTFIASDLRSAIERTMVPIGMAIRGIQSGVPSIVGASRSPYQLASSSRISCQLNTTQNVSDSRSKMTCEISWALGDNLCWTNSTW